MIDVSALCFGFTAIDYVCREDGRLIGASLGGTAANVCAALSRLGVRAGLATTIGDDARGDFAIEAMAREGLPTQLVERRHGYATPFCIETLKQRDGEYSGHSFRSIILRDSQRSSRFVGPSRDMLTYVMDECSGVKVLFANKQFDGIIDVIRRYSPIFFYEPDCIDMPELHRELVSRCDIYKFSHEQFIDFAHDFTSDAVNVVIETFGSEGFRFKLSGGGDWKHLAVSGGGRLLDTTGAGDWFSGGLIAAMLRADHNRQSATDLGRAIWMAAKISRLSCSYVGATGFAAEQGWEERLKDMTIVAGPHCAEFANEERLAAAVADPHSVQ